MTDAVDKLQKKADKKGVPLRKADAEPAEAPLGSGIAEKGRKTIKDAHAKKKAMLDQL